LRKAFSRSTQKTRLGIALQGGGSYGAYTKGVLKALFNSKAFNDPSMEIAAVAGTSAGAVNGTLITYGLNTGGPKEAIRILDLFWDDIAKKNSMTPAFDPMGIYMPNLSPAAAAAANMLPKGYLSAKIKDMLTSYIPDWGKVQNGPVKLFVNAVKEDPATKERNHIVFKGKDLTADSITASGALHQMGAFEINGEHYYDGAYWRNPCMTDIRKENITDMLIITLQDKPKDGIKAEHQDIARDNKTAPGHELITEEIHNHIAYIHKTHPHINLHVISLDVETHWGETSRQNTDPRWLAALEKAGYEDGKKWLKQNARTLGQKSSYEPPAQPQSSGPAPT